MDEGVETALAVTDDLFLIEGMEVSPDWLLYYDDLIKVPLKSVEI